MKDKKRIKILLEVIERTYSKNQGIQTQIDESMMDICKEKSASSKQVFLLLFAVGFIFMGYLNTNFLCAKDSLFLVVIKKKNHVEFFDARILRV